MIYIQCFQWTETYFPRFPAFTFSQKELFDSRWPRPPLDLIHWGSVFPPPPLVSSTFILPLAALHSTVKLGQEDWDFPWGRKKVNILCTSRVSGRQGDERTDTRGSRKNVTGERVTGWGISIFHELNWFGVAHPRRVFNIFFVTCSSEDIFVKETQTQTRVVKFKDILFFAVLNRSIFKKSFVSSGDTWI